MTKIFISGPMTGYPEFNYPLFNLVAKALRHKGYKVENPAENAACETWADYMRLSICQVLVCDVVYTLPNWQDSKGAVIEVGLAQELGLPIFAVSESLLNNCPAAVECGTEFPH